MLSIIEKNCADVLGLFSNPTAITLVQAEVNRGKNQAIWLCRPNQDIAFAFLMKVDTRTTVGESEILLGLKLITAGVRFDKGITVDMKIFNGEACDLERMLKSQLDLDWLDWKDKYDLLQRVLQKVAKQQGLTSWLVDEAYRQLIKYGHLRSPYR